MIEQEICSPDQDTGAPEHRLWSAVILLLIDDARHVKKAMTNYFNTLVKLKNNPDFFTKISNQQTYLCLEAWEGDRQRIVNEVNSEWFLEVCAFINFCDRKIRNSIMEWACVDQKIISELRFWRDDFRREIEEREKLEVIYNKGRTKKKRREYRLYQL